MKKLVEKTKIFNELSELLKDALNKFVTEVNNNEEINSCLRHITVLNTPDVDSVFFIIHNRQFTIIPVFDLASKSVKLKTYETVPDFDNIGNNKRINIYGVDFVIGSEIVLKTIDAKKYFTVLMDGLYKDKN